MYLVYLLKCKNIYYKIYFLRGFIKVSIGILFPGQGSQSIGMLKDLKGSYKIVTNIN